MSDSLPETAARSPLIVGLVGAESTGKTTLARSMVEALSADRLGVTRVDEFLRDFCDQHGRTPLQHEQRMIAQTQSDRIAAAAQSGADIVIADTTALMIAVYSDFIFGDRSLYADAEAAQQQCTLSLLTSLDLPWIADGLQRDGEHVRAPIDQLVRASLQRSGVSYAVVAGSGKRRLDAALAAVRHAWQQHRQLQPAQPRWHWVCDRCGDTGCERHWLMQSRAAVD
ncbi:MAG: ATP-binding protein [Ideonella sp.]